GNNACGGGGGPGGPGGPGGNNCDDNNACTTDSCVSNQCKHVVLNGVACVDANACTVAETCVSGICLGKSVVCDDKNPCTSDACVNGLCAATVLSGSTGSDGNPCTTGDLCQGGACQAGKAVICNDSNPCTSDACNPASGLCSFTGLAEGASCS